MNLAELRGHLSQVNLNALNISYSSADRNPQGAMRYDIKNLRDLRNTVNALENIDSLSELISNLRETPVFKTYADSLVVESDEHTKVTKLSSELKAAALSIFNFIGTMLSEENEYAIRIKLPPVKDFEEMEKVMNDLKRAISIPINEEGVGGQIIIDRVESGSIWFFVILSTERALRLIAELSWSAVVVLNKRKEVDFVSQEVRSLEIANDYKEAVVEAQKKLLNILVESEAAGVHSRVSENGSDISSESSQRLMLSINTMASLFERGAQIQPSLQVREDVANLFPKAQNQNLIESKNKRLGEGNKNA